MDDIIDTLIGQNTKIKGDIKFSGSIRIVGFFEGNLNSENGTVIIGEHAKVQADINTKVAIIKGTVNGNINAKVNVEVFVPAKITGNIKSPNIAMESGVIFNGKCKMDKRNRIKTIARNTPEKIVPTTTKKDEKTLLKSLTNVFSQAK